MARFPEAIELVNEPGYLPPLASLIIHVAGNHLGRYADGLDLLARPGPDESSVAEAPDERRELVPEERFVAGQCRRSSDSDSRS